LAVGRSQSIDDALTAALPILQDQEQPSEELVHCLGAFSMTGRNWWR
jgi:hypothetical protein